MDVIKNPKSSGNGNLKEMADIVYALFAAKIVTRMLFIWPFVK